MSAAFNKTMQKIYHLPDESIIDKIYVIRGLKVMIDRDLAELYDLETKRLKEKVRRNIKRFPGDFMFVLTRDEYKILRSQIATLEKGLSKYRPMVFTEQGVAWKFDDKIKKKSISSHIGN